MASLGRYMMMSCFFLTEWQRGADLWYGETGCQWPQPDDEGDDRTFILNDGDINSCQPLSENGTIRMRFLRPHNGLTGKVHIICEGNVISMDDI